jgi:hypothetical protein
MKLNAFYRQTKSCRPAPTRYGFAWRGNSYAFTTAHDAFIWRNDLGIDDLNEVLRLLIDPIDCADRKSIHQIPIADSLI